MWIDRKYIGLLSPRLSLYKVKDDQSFTVNFRCPVCGDSKKNRTKARGYVFEGKGGLLYKCHNCSYSGSLGKLIKEIDPVLYDQYSLDRYKEGVDAGPTHRAHSNTTFTFTPPKFKKRSLLDELLDRLDTLPEDNPAIQYCCKREIPRAQWSKLYYINDISKIEQLSSKYKDRIIGTEPRLIIPFYDVNGMLAGVTCRALGDERLRYVTIRIQDEVPLIFNLNDVKTDKDIIVVEGPIDSMFLDNSVAVAGSDLKKINYYFDKNKLVLVFDNQPRNKEIVKLMINCARQNYRMAVWPLSVTEKDINEMILNGYTTDDVYMLINKNTFQGLELEVAINNWKKCI
jgi:transcription elongation factor Elf1